LLVHVAVSVIEEEITDISGGTLVTPKTATWQQQIYSHDEHL
jgi:hypothetical protein